MTTNSLYGVPQDQKTDRTVEFFLRFNVKYFVAESWHNVSFFIGIFFRYVVCCLQVNLKLSNFRIIKTVQTKENELERRLPWSGILWQKQLVLTSKNVPVVAGAH